MLISQFGCETTKKVKKGARLLFCVVEGGMKGLTVTNAHLRHDTYVAVFAVAMAQSGKGWPRRLGSFLRASALGAERVNG